MGWLLPSIETSFPNVQTFSLSEGNIQFPCESNEVQLVAEFVRVTPLDQLNTGNPKLKHMFRQVSKDAKLWFSVCTSMSRRIFETLVWGRDDGCLHGN